MNDRRKTVRGFVDVKTISANSAVVESRTTEFVSTIEERTATTEETYAMLRRITGKQEEIASYINEAYEESLQIRL